MQSVQRRFGKFLPRTADESQVAVLLKDFDDADKMLAKIVDASRSWRDSWRDILGTQQRLVHGFQTLYSPIVGSDDTYSGHEPVITPRATMERATRLQGDYTELRNDMLEEIDVMETRLIQPAADAKSWIQPLKKVIKKRGDRKLDFEKYQKRVDNARNKTKRSERDNASLAKAEIELERAKDEYNVADDHLKSSLPPVITAAFSLLPRLLAVQIMTQNTLLSQMYTVLHDFSQDQGLPSPPPPMVEVISVWNADFKPVQKEVETNIACIARGHARHQPLRLEDRSNSFQNENTRNGYLQRRETSQPRMLKPPPSPSISASSDPPSPGSNDRPRIYSVPSQNSLSLSTPNYNPSSVRSPSPNGIMTIHAPAGPHVDYFTRDRVSSNSSLASIAAAKKKPPPPPTKRKPSTQEFWVTALYEFAGQGQGDLAFREGDRIKVVKRTDSTDDWWEGELKGVLGSFPANYCQAT